jgi:uncharacterized membrane protein YgcG
MQMEEEKDKLKLNQPLALEKWTYKGKPLRILSTTLGIALVANMLLLSNAYGESPSPTPVIEDSPKLVEYSSEAVKKYYDPSGDWNIPVPFDDKGQPTEQVQAGSGASGSESSTGNTTIINNGGGYGGGGIGWTDLLLFHMIFNRGGMFSSNQWNNSRPIFSSGTNRPYQAKSFTSDTFQNKPTTGSTVRPKTSKSSGTFSTKNSKSTSSTKGGIGGKSSGFSSSGKSSGSSFGS